jgi:CRISPR-associated endonuclease Csn1
MEYQAFMVLNTINNLRIKNEKLPCSLKQDIYKEIFEKKSKVTKKNIADYLNKRGYISDDNELTGVDTVIGCSLSTYRKFRDILGEEIAKDDIKHMVEDIVFMGTVHGDSKKMFKKQVFDKYGEILTEEQINRIAGIKFKDWGNLSKQFLELNGINKSTGELTTLIRALWEDEDNLNKEELINSDKYTFGENLNEKHKEGLKTLSEFTYDDLQEMYFSAPVKRMIWQTLLIIKEVEKIMGCPPKKIFVEMTRSDEEIKGDAGRKDSREKELLELYRKEGKEWDKEIKEAGASGKLRSKKLYLYYKQMGCDMYTGLPIDLSELFDDNKYDIDHIYPRHFVKDDSIHNNLVLVDKRKNSRKSDNYPLDESIRNNTDVTNLWHTLRLKGFISEEKYRRLTGSGHFTDEQKAHFISRQLVETSQATKGVNDLLKELMPENTILVYAKAKNVSDFRNEFKFYKSRTINDFHHAHDAYLNIVVGNVYYTKFTANPLNFIKNVKEDYHLGKMYDRDIVRNGYVAWIAPKKDEAHNIIEDGMSLTVVKKMMAKNTPMLTRLNTTQHGTLSDANIKRAAEAKNGVYLPIKTNNEKLADVEKYGGFKNVKNAYMFLVEHEIAGKGKDKGNIVKIRTLECLPIYKQAQVESYKDGLYKYCLELGLKNPSIRVPKIKMQPLVKVDGFPIYIGGKKLKQFVVYNACNMILNSDWNRYIHDLDKYNTSNIISSYISAEKNMELYDELLYKHSSGIFKKRPNSISKILSEGRKKFEQLSIDRQIYVLTQILNLSLICNSATADLREIGGSAKSGVSAINKVITGYSDFTLINQSVTGVYEKEVDLLKV